MGVVGTTEGAVNISPARVLVVEDDPATSRIVQYLLAREGYIVSLADSASQALAEFTRCSPDLVLLDISLPDSDGFSLLRRLRAQLGGYQVPVIFVTAHTTAAEHVYGLETGADDYIDKPFDPAELIARVRAVLRRSKRQPVNLIQHGDLEIDLRSGAVRRAGVPVELSRTEHLLLVCLARDPLRIWSREALLDAVWGYAANTTHNLVDVTVARLRHKIETDPLQPRHLHTVRGQGYRFGDREPP